jgi:hypothetical protein
MISVRVAYYSQGDRSSVSGMLPTIRFDHAEATSLYTHTHLTEINSGHDHAHTHHDIVEMDRFNDQQGV